MRLSIHLFFVLFAVNLINCSEFEAEKAEGKLIVLNAVIRKLFELFRNVIINGCHEKDIPIMDPYVVDNATLSASNDISNFTMNIFNIEIIGISNFELHEFNFSKTDISMEVELAIPMISLQSGYYELEGSILETLPLAGNGKILIKMYDILMQGKVNLMQSDDKKSILIDEIEAPYFSVARVTSDTEFDGNIDGIINHMIEDLIADYVTKFNAYLYTIYGHIVVQTINSILDKFETWPMLAAIL